MVAQIFMIQKARVIWGSLFIVSTWMINKGVFRRARMSP
ncbi:hypothetical protein ALO59_102563 [Pseudomonas amygdali pv. mellea]|uniref:Uncharacterized protein n=1 Tax=Pseudomonas amygdali pv. lachrymans TaxID=53707 RepID=A0A0N0X414_PSEAV|nr:Unknown protein sequence [Pseudomonas amygdali pv. sesami]KPB97605.1 Unknown protein sequence [Pseudomonas amygdali pv. lachrymans]KPX83521.1 hypothetical protein ALO59_102563 [Pseudomonas amygdali pv. mellea]KPC18916.1 Unknown protein sequence [Pseudomonas amygdali pv. lachrymans]KPX73784.1 hypothetical protein ALO35_102817 [Pseudomonas amygdali pv. lachrymans]